MLNKCTKTVASQKKADFTSNINYEKNESLKSRNKSSIKDLCSKISDPLNLGNDEGEKQRWKKNETPANRSNSSTLSLHISAYENSIEATDLNGKDSKKEHGKSSTIKKWKNAKQIYSSPIIKDPFEFPRQQKDVVAKPEVMQFKASQRLFNPHPTEDPDKERLERFREGILQFIEAYKDTKQPGGEHEEAFLYNFKNSNYNDLCNSLLELATSNSSSEQLVGDWLQLFFNILEVYQPEETHVIEFISNFILVTQTNGNIEFLKFCEGYYRQVIGIMTAEARLLLHDIMLQDIQENRLILTDAAKTWLYALELLVSKETQNDRRCLSPFLSQAIKNQISFDLDTPITDFLREGLIFPNYRKRSSNSDIPGPSKKISLAISGPVDNIATSSNGRNITDPTARKTDCNGSLIFEKFEFHLIRDVVGKTSLIVIVDLQKDQCWSYRQLNDGRCQCRACDSKVLPNRHRTFCTIDTTKDEVLVMPEHVCEPRSYYAEMTDLLGGQLLCGKAFNHEDYGMLKFESGEFEIFDYIEKAATKKKLLVPIPELFDRCYEFGQRLKCTGINYYCLGCNVGKQSKTLRARIVEVDDEQVLYMPNSHNCQPRVYSVITQNLKQPIELESTKSYEIVQHATGKGVQQQHLIIFLDENKTACYVYRLVISSNGTKHYYCNGCTRHNVSTRANICQGDDGEIYVMYNKNHVCTPKDYENQMEKWFSATPADRELCDFFDRDNNTKGLKVFVDDSKTLAYEFTFNSRNNLYYCLGCTRRNYFTAIRVNDDSVILYRPHICYPEVLELPLVIAEFRLCEWPTGDLGVEQLEKFRKQQFIFHRLGENGELRNHDEALAATYVLSPVPPSSPPALIASNIVYNGFSTKWVKRASVHDSSKNWEELYQIFGTLYLYPILIDTVPMTAELEALGISLKKSGSLDLPMRNIYNGKYYNYDYTKNVYPLEELAANPQHPEHAELLLAYRRYIINALSNPALIDLCLDIRKMGQTGDKNPINHPLGGWYSS